MVKSSFNPATCYIGTENRALIMNLKEDIKRVETKVDTGFKEVNTQITELFNHQSSRWPPVAAWALATIGTLFGAALAVVITKFFGG